MIYVSLGYQEREEKKFFQYKNRRQGFISRSNTGHVFLSKFLCFDLLRNSNKTILHIQVIMLEEFQSVKLPDGKHCMNIIIMETIATKLFAVVSLHFPWINEHQFASGECSLK